MSERRADGRGGGRVHPRVQTRPSRPTRRTVDPAGAAEHFATKRRRDGGLEIKRVDEFRGTDTATPSRLASMAWRSTRRCPGRTRLSQAPDAPSYASSRRGRRRRSMASSRGLELVTKGPNGPRSQMRERGSRGACVASNVTTGEEVHDFGTNAAALATAGRRDEERRRRPAARGVGVGRRGGRDASIVGLALGLVARARAVRLSRLVLDDLGDRAVRRGAAPGKLQRYGGDEDKLDACLKDLSIPLPWLRPCMSSDYQW